MGCCIPKVILFSGHIFWQVIHRMHSPDFVPCPSLSIAPIPQLSTHRPQLVHDDETVLLNIVHSEKSARMAPIGHIFLHQYRLNTMPAAINRTNTMRRNPVPSEGGRPLDRPNMTIPAAVKPTMSPIRGIALK